VPGTERFTIIIKRRFGTNGIFDALRFLARRIAYRWLTMIKGDFAKLGDELKSYYEVLRASPLPDQLVVLAQQLEARLLNTDPNEPAAGPAALSSSDEAMQEAE
jgi:hypothetical protein